MHFIPLYILILIAIFYLLARVCDDYFVESLELISKKLKLSDDVSGATFMAIGSSAPELFTAVMALVIPGNHEQLGAGTIVGSAIFNILVIIGLSATVATAYLNWQPIMRDSLFYIVSILFLLFAFKDGVITSSEAFMFVSLYVVYIFAVVYWKKLFPFKEVRGKAPPPQVVTRKGSEESRLSSCTKMLLRPFFPDLGQHPQRYMQTFLIAILFIGLLSWGLVETAVLMAHALNISDSIIALTVLAGGTSIPDLLSSLIVAKRGRGGMAVSNAIGSNIFDILIGLGLPWFVYTLVKGNVVVSTENLYGSIVLLFATVFAVVFLMMLQKWKMRKESGIILVAFYLCYLGYTIYVAVAPEGMDGLQEMQASFADLSADDVKAALTDVFSF